MVYIYAIKNLVNNKVYVGSTKALKRRKYSHFGDLKKGKHHSIHLQRAYDKYGKDKFSFYVLEECSADNRKEREIFFINDMKSCDRDYGYNIIEVDGTSFSFSQESKDKMFDSNKTKISIDLYSVDGTFLETFRSTHACYLKHGIPTGALSQILNGKRKSSHGYVVVKHGEPFNYTPSSKQRDMSKFRK